MIIWQKIYSGLEFDVADDVIELEDDGFVIAGRTNSFTENQVAWLFKIDSYGTIQWQKIYGEVTFNEVVVDQAPDGGFYLVGSTTAYGAGSSDILVHKTNSQGDISGCGFVQSSNAVSANSNLAETNTGTTSQTTNYQTVQTSSIPQTILIEVTNLCGVGSRLSNPER